jgi:hypothetical protein
VADELVEEDVLLTPPIRTGVLLESPCRSSVQIIDGLLEELGNARLEEEEVLSTPVNRIVGLLEEALLPFNSFNMTGVLLEEEVDTDEMLDVLVEGSYRTDVLLEEEDGLSTPVNRIVGLLEEEVLSFAALEMTGVLFAEEADLDGLLDVLLGELDRTYMPPEGADVLRLPLNKAREEGLCAISLLEEDEDVSSILLRVSLWERAGALLLEEVADALFVVNVLVVLTAAAF